MFNENTVNNKIETKYSIEQGNEYFAEREDPIVEKKKSESKYDKYENTRKEEENLFSKNQVT